ncbi:syntaxin 6, N-terminal-domain-containing protein [Sporodiniella umbellata]|nr:syntaxin 6, N-terminal-domain-containing protein [Sporodiniella umbellata]
MEQDPFLIVKSQVEDNITNAANLFASWKRIQQTVSSPKNQELVWTADELQASLDAIEQDLDDLQEALDMSQFKLSEFNLTQNDVQARKHFLNTSREFTIMREQDHHLDAMGGTLINLKEIAGTMNREMDDHAILIDELGDGVDRSEGRLNNAMRRITDILRKEEGRSY